MKTKHVVIGAGVVLALGGLAYYHRKKITDVVQNTLDKKGVTVSPTPPQQTFVAPVEQLPALVVDQPKPAVDFAALAKSVFSPPVPAVEAYIPASSYVEKKAVSEIIAFPKPSYVEPVKETISPIANQPANYSQPTIQMIDTSSFSYGGGGYSNQSYSDYQDYTKDQSVQNFSGLGVLF